MYTIIGIAVSLVLMNNLDQKQMKIYNLGTKTWSMRKQPRDRKINLLKRFKERGKKFGNYI